MHLRLEARLPPRTIFTSMSVAADLLLSSEAINSLLCQCASSLSSNHQCEGESGKGRDVDERMYQVKQKTNAGITLSRLAGISCMIG